MKAKGANLHRRPASERLPLIFGISGHRDLVVGDVPQLRDRLREIFARFRAAYPHTPFRLLTPLAEGADRLTAEVALASKIGLLVPLPMARREYERDFRTAESLSEFRALLALAESHWELAVSPKRGSAGRTAQYAEVGDLIARQSHVLILLWDGKDNRKVGGTAWVRRRREYWINATSNTYRDIGHPGYGPTIHVVTPRASGRLPQPRLATIGELPPSAAEFAVTLSKYLGSGRGGARKKPPPLHQLVYWAINCCNAAVPGSTSARKKRAKRQSGTRSRL